MSISSLIDLLCRIQYGAIYNKIAKLLYITKKHSFLQSKPKKLFICLRGCRAFRLAIAFFSTSLENLRHQHVSHRRAVTLPCGVVLFRITIVDAEGTVNE